ncbi:hypothetical protein [Desulfonatronum thiosulfatophilum]|uniref:hypothetical protein n=1 Tax=Desulfonatronum thiosulfatophilum TaxID=617002 RepID=UPI003CC66791
MHQTEKSSHPVAVYIDNFGFTIHHAIPIAFQDFRWTSGNAHPGLNLGTDKIK